ncbi:unnamed protein product [Ectocarpus sp. 12 AP-2014]
MNKSEDQKGPGRKLQKIRDSERHTVESARMPGKWMVDLVASFLRAFKSHPDSIKSKLKQRSHMNGASEEEFDGLSCSGLSLAFLLEDLKGEKRYLQEPGSSVPGI